MNWKRMLITVILISAMTFVFFSSNNRNRRGAHYSSYDYAQDALGAIALALGSVGSQELRARGNKKTSNILFGGSLIWGVISLFPIVKMPMWFPISFGIFGLLLASPFHVVLT